MRADRVLLILAVAGVVCLGVMSSLRERRLDERMALLTDALDRVAERPTIQLGGATLPAAAPSLPAAAPTVAKPVEREPDVDRPERRVDPPRSLEDARGTLDGALSRGRWRRDDVVRMREQLAGSDPDEARELVRQLIVAINSEKVVPEDPAFLLP